MTDVTEGSGEYFMPASLSRAEWAVVFGFFTHDAGGGGGDGVGWAICN